MKGMILGNVKGEFLVQFDSIDSNELITSITEIERWIGSVIHE